MNNSASIQILNTVLLAGLALTSCSGPTAYNPGDPGSDDFYALRLLACLTNSPSCRELTPAADPFPCAQVSSNGTIDSCTLNLTGVVTTLAGSGTNGTADGLGTAADIGGPNGMATDGRTLFISQAHSARVMTVDPATGLTTTLAGSTNGGHADGVGTAAQFWTIRNIATDGTYVYVADATNHRIRRVEVATGNVTTIAGDGTNTHNDATGTAASFKFPTSVAVVGNDIYIGDSNNKVLRKIDGTTLAVTTPAGMVGSSGMMDATGTAASSGPCRAWSVRTDKTCTFVITRIIPFARWTCLRSP